MIWLYGQNCFLNFSLFGTHVRERFQVHAINLSVAIWVEFLPYLALPPMTGFLWPPILMIPAAGFKENKQELTEYSSIKMATGVMYRTYK